MAVHVRTMSMMGYSESFHASTPRDSVITSSNTNEACEPVVFDYHEKQRPAKKPPSSFISSEQSGPWKRRFLFCALAFTFGLMIIDLSMQVTGCECHDSLAFMLVDAILFSILTICLSINTVSLFFLLHALQHQSWKDKIIIGGVSLLFTLSYMSTAGYMLF